MPKLTYEKDIPKLLHQSQSLNPGPPIGLVHGPEVAPSTPAKRQCLKISLNAVGLDRIAVATETNASQSISGSVDAHTATRLGSEDEKLDPRPRYLGRETIRVGENLRF